MIRKLSHWVPCSGVGLGALVWPYRGTAPIAFLSPDGSKGKRQIPGPVLCSPTGCLHPHGHVWGSQFRSPLSFLELSSPWLSSSRFPKRFCFIYFNRFSVEAYKGGTCAPPMSMSNPCSLWNTFFVLFPFPHLSTSLENNLQKQLQHRKLLSLDIHCN